MSAGGLRRMLSHAVKGVCCRAGPRCDNAAPSWGRVPFSTAADGADGSPAPAAIRKKQDPRARATIGSIGRKIHQRHLLVISETGENLGTMHRADVIRLMDEQGLKLVPLNEHADPPVYRLMSGKQLHEEQLKLREKQKAKAGLVQVKELTFSSDIATHDLATKLKQVQSWLEKKQHVRVTLRAGRTGAAGAAGAAGALDTTLEQMVQQLDVMVGFVSKPKVLREGQAAMCILRPPSAKELSQNKREGPSVEPTAGSGSEPDQPDTSPVSPRDATKDSKP